MNRDQTQDSSDESFYSSKKSELGKLRRWTWLGGAIGLAISAVSTRGSMDVLLISTVFLLLILVPMDWTLRKRLRTGQPIVTLSHDAIVSPIFTGRNKRYRWSDVVSVSVETKGAQCLQFQLTKSPEWPDKRSFLTGVNYARPTIPINSFEPEVQEKLLEGVNRRLQQAGGDAGKEPPVLVNPLTEARQFQERLKSLAPIPWITYLLIAINLLVWGITVTNGSGFLQAPTDKLLLWGGNAASEVQRGEWWRLLTATFLHSGFLHLAMNMLGLVGVGITVERIYGHRLFALIYLGSGLIGSALSLHFSAQHAVSVGASGAIFGVAGALLVGVFQHREQLPKIFGKQTLSSIGFFVVYSLMQGFSNHGIDNAAHVGGLVGGCLLAFLLPERFDMEHFIRNLKRRAIAGIVVVFAATTGVAAIAPHAVLDQRKILEGHAAFQRGMNGLGIALKAMQQEHQDTQAGKLTERESDERSRTVYAPMFRMVLQDFSRVVLPPSDPRVPLLKEYKRMAELMTESLEMQSVYKEGSDEPEAADPERMDAISAELKEVSARMQRLGQDAKTKQQR